MTHFAFAEYAKDTLKVAELSERILERHEEIIRVARLGRKSSDWQFSIKHCGAEALPLSFCIENPGLVAGGQNLASFALPLPMTQVGLVGRQRSSGRVQ